MNRLLPAGIVLCLAAIPASAWWGQSHGLITRAAISVASKDLPPFFHNGVVTIAHAAVDPDVVKNRAAPAAREAEYPEHYFDVEMLDGREAPRSRFDFIKMCCELGIRPEKAGMLPYALMEQTERLAVAFAEYRKWPKNPHVQSKCLIYAGPLAHYAQDLCQPLHLTIHFDGRANPDGSSPKSGIHEKIDGLVEHLSLTPAAIAAGAKPAAVDSAFTFIMNEIVASRALIDTAYALESQYPSAKGTEVSAPVRAFTLDRTRRAAEVTAGLYAYAWKLSERIQFENWLDRDGADKVKR